MAEQARQHIRAYAGPPVARTVRLSDVYGSASSFDGGGGMDYRRKGKFFGASALTNATAWQYRSWQRMLSPEMLWQVYTVCTDVRSAADGIIRKVSTWDWGVIPTVDPADDRYELALDIAEEAQRFLMAPNTDGQTWQDLISEAVRDLMVYDALAIELCDGSDGTLEELVVQNAGYIFPVVDNKGRTTGYAQQQPGETDQVVFEPDELMYMNLFPNTNHPGGMPIIESIINQVITCMTASKHLMLALDADEVPPGILMIAGVGGSAGKKMVEGLKNMRGQDNKIRVLTTNNPRALSANWVELRHTPKDLDLKDVIKEVKRTIWRAYGRKPASMGDTEATPRASAEVQMGAEESDLIIPILELLQAKLNMRVMPRVVGDPETASLVAFAFDMGKKLSEEDLAKRAESNSKKFDRGVLTANEWRDQDGQTPVDGGDVPLIKAGGGYVPLVDLAAGPIPVGDEVELDPAGDGEDGDGGQDTDAAAPEEGEEGPGEVEASVPRYRRRQLTARRRMPGHHTAALRKMGRLNAARPLRRGHGDCCGTQRRASDLLPSDWQPSGRFKNYRTLNLQGLGEEVIDYRRRVSPLYRQAKQETLAAFRSYLGDDHLDNAEAAQLGARIGSILDKLAFDWSATTTPMYRATARIGRDAATNFSGQQVVDDWQDRGDAYHDMAMGYLTGTRGLVTDLRQQLLTLVAASVRGSKVLPSHIRADDVTADAMLQAVTTVYDRNEHRISNWGGRLVDLANLTVVFGMLQAGSVAVDDDDPEGTDGARASVWMVEWVAVGDDRMCATCEGEAAKGFQPLATLSTMPGGDTECRANDRCVLVFWLRSEVQSGEAVKLNP